MGTHFGQGNNQHILFEDEIFGFAQRIREISPFVSSNFFGAFQMMAQTEIAL